MFSERRSRMVTGLLFAAALVAGTLGVAGTADAGQAGAVSGPAQLSPDVAASAQGTGPDAHARALAAYWTSGRMKAARPDTEMPSVKDRASAAPSQAAQTKPDGLSGKVAPTAPSAEPKGAPQATANPGAAPAAYYPNYAVGHPVARTSGKVFFTSFGVDYVCSATVVNSEGRSEVWTAGHCVSDGAAWNYNWTFVPNYASGYAPYGYWYAYQLWTTNAWFYNNNDFANDVGAAVMYRNAGWRITDYLGGQGIAWNYPIGYYMYAFGYPQAAPFNGCCLTAENNYTYDGGGGTIYMLNYMTGGSSGGAWLNFFDGNWGYINGHNDFKYNALPQYMYSPYYGNQVANLYATVRGIST